ncbi:MAG: hypothetical protein ACREMY_00345 [bacterium]
MAKDEQPTPDEDEADDKPKIIPPELDSETWLRAQENIMLFGNALRVIAANAEEPDIMKVAINALIRSGMQSMFLSEEL